MRGAQSHGPSGDRPYPLCSTEQRLERPQVASGRGRGHIGLGPPWHASYRRRRRIESPSLTRSGNDEPVDGERFWRVTVDVNVLGTLYNSPFRIQACEENAGKSNTSTVRIESNGVFVVQRVRRGGRDCDRLVETSPYPYAGGDCRRARTLWKAVQRNRPPLGGLGCLRLRDPLNRGGSHEPWVG